MEKFLEALKERAGFFLIEMGGFKPFRAFVLDNGEIRDIVSSSEICSVEEMYDLFLKDVEQDLNNIDIKVSAIVLSGQVDGYDVVVIEIFSHLQEKYQVVYPYNISGETVIFGVDANKEYHTNIRR
ncbi:hypothetical protein A0O34_21690 [Chryseobacterium glaciei]|uniref:Uncharacterized protein n=1 Tax=Chryseobacterium glaciei TaxID=1685010 RepID=A0A172Y1I7_9FLAO|nr:hypothetical protein [Chryseobacterium glaciei]ANF52976.1 hypothetical protein A0O34_21690 [Chryseobacterium glaciei]